MLDYFTGSTVLFQLVFATVSFGLLILGADVLVRGGASLGLRLGLTPLQVGLTIVALGTSAPELFICGQAALSGDEAVGNLAIGNIVGSNIVNIGLVLGVTVMIYPCTIKSKLVSVEIPFLIGITILFLFMLWDEGLYRWEALLLLVILAGFTYYTIRNAGKDPQEVLEEYEGEVKETPSLLLDILFVLGGTALLYVGSEVMVNNAVKLARTLHVTEAIIGLTVVAFGTSVPELATTVVAAFKKEADIAVGNIVGSCILNIIAIGGITGLLLPRLAADQISSVDMGTVLLLTALLLPLMWTGLKLDRWEGGLFLLIYAGYTGFLIYSVG